jgi:hypothetical protein
MNQTWSLVNAQGQPVQRHSVHRPKRTQRTAAASLGRPGGSAMATDLCHGGTPPRTSAGLLRHRQRDRVLAPHIARRDRRIHATSWCVWSRSRPRHVSPMWTLKPTDGPRRTNCEVPVPDPRRPIQARSLVVDAAHHPYQRAVRSLRDEGATVVAGVEYDWEPHEPGIGEQRALKFPWARALSEADAAARRAAL